MIPIRGASLPEGYAETVHASGILKAVAMEFAPDGRLFVCQQAGKLRVIKNGVLLSDPFLTLDVDDLAERGLLGVAFDPNFAANHYLYVFYTAKEPTVHNRVSRFTADGDVAVPGSETILLELDDLSAVNHNGGAIHFGSDGKLYIGSGDNGIEANSQTLENLLGKMLRINSDGSIPEDNPFFESASGRTRAIWALGFRNPFTFAVQPGSGRIFVNDVGSGWREEIDELWRGGNYGWPNCEGECTPTESTFRDPLHFYERGAGTRKGFCIAGGTFYNPPTNQFPATERGAYYFSDFVNGWINRLNPDTLEVSNFASGISRPVDLKTGPDGRLYYLSLGAGSVTAIQWTNTVKAVAGSPGSAGSYQGLFHDAYITTRHEASGFFSLVRRANGIYSGRLQQGTTRYSFTGKFDEEGRATNRVTRPGTNDIIVELRFEADDQIKGIINGGTWQAELLADRATFNARLNPATNFASQYTWLVPGKDDSPEPAGDGVGSLTINTSGIVTFTGVLADGSAAAQRVALSRNGAWPLYVPLYGGRGSLFGWIQITNSAQVGSGGYIGWSRPPGPRPKAHTNGFDLVSTLNSSVYRPPGTNTIFEEASAVVRLTDGDLSRFVTDTVTLAPRAKVTSTGTNKLTLNLTQKNGAFSGRLTPPGAAQPVNFRGVILQTHKYGGGFFLGTNQSGRVEFYPEP